MWRKAPEGADFPEHSYSLMGQNLLVADKPGPAKLVVAREQQIMCEQGDVIGWRLETGDAAMGFEPFGDGQVRVVPCPDILGIGLCAETRPARD